MRLAGLVLEAAAILLGLLILTLVVQASAWLIFDFEITLRRTLGIGLLFGFRHAISTAAQPPTYRINFRRTKP